MDDIARKKMAHVIAIGIGSPKGEKKESESEEPLGPDEGLIAAMEELLAGIAKKDAVAMAEAFESAHAIACANKEAAYEPDKDDSE